ncbi:hypothetical protein [Calycomorphotria hydatis]|uniref:Uncharacterized protein n=1 Tax=Calycomorphotria hydatis TaxID=2528027 RepID=A0A517T503_9PLAN|nr:hypothetical protein [Calycomorphotria hydatis]QDT63449.1 hypothetical protein V22_06710 [Calycomorphotria hydatis]
MGLIVPCQKCGKKYQFKEEFAGKIFRCKSCSATVRIPIAEETIEVEPEIEVFPDAEPDGHVHKHIAPAKRRKPAEASYSKRKTHSGTQMKSILGAVVFIVLFSAAIIGFGGKIWKVAGRPDLTPFFFGKTRTEEVEFITGVFNYLDNCTEILENATDPSDALNLLKVANLRGTELVSQGDTILNTIQKELSSGQAKKQEVHERLNAVFSEQYSIADIEQSNVFVQKRMNSWVEAVNKTGRNFARNSDNTSVALGNEISSTEENLAILFSMMGDPYEFVLSVDGEKLKREFQQKRDRSQLLGLSPFQQRAIPSPINSTTTPPSTAVDSSPLVTIRVDKASFGASRYLEQKFREKMDYAPYNPREVPRKITVQPSNTYSLIYLRTSLPRQQLLDKLGLAQAGNSSNRYAASVKNLDDLPFIQTHEVERRNKIYKELQRLGPPNGGPGFVKENRDRAILDMIEQGYEKARIACLLLRKDTADFGSGLLAMNALPHEFKRSTPGAITERWNIDAGIVMWLAPVDQPLEEFARNLEKFDIVEIDQISQTIEVVPKPRS